MEKDRRPDSEARVDADDIVYWAKRLNVAPEELRSEVQRGGAMMKDVADELRRHGLEPSDPAATKGEGEER